MRMALLCLILILLLVRDGPAQPLDLEDAPVSVCDLIENGRAYNSLHVAVHGTLVRGVLQPHGCYAEIVTDGYLWPTCITLQQSDPAQGSTGKRLLPFSDDNPVAGFSVVLVGRFEMGTEGIQEETTGRPPGRQTPTRCPATLVYERVVSVQPVVVPAISVCDLVASPLRYNNAVVTVRGRFVVENGLDVLRGNNCAGMRTRQPGRIAPGIPFTHLGSISPTSREDRDGGNLAVMMTVTGRFVAAKAGSAPIEKRSADKVSQVAYPGELIYSRTRHVKIEVTDKRR